MTVFGAPEGRSGAITEKAETDQNTRIVIDVECRRGDLHSHGGDKGVGRCGKDAARRFEHGEGRSATQTKEILQKNVVSQSKPLGDVTGQAGTEISGTSANEKGVDFFRLHFGFFAGGTQSLCGKARGMFLKKPMQGAGIGLENRGEVIGTEPARRDAGWSRENLFQHFD